MKEILEKIEDFLFDFLGLTIPGILFNFFLLFPIYLIEQSKISSQREAYFLIYLNELAERISFAINKYSDTALLVVFILFSYIIGHTIKVFSKLQYDFFESIFDNFLIGPLFGKISSWKITERLKKIAVLNFLGKLFEKLFYFEPKKYNENIKNYVFKKIKDKDSNFSDDWHEVYKYSRILIAQENIKSLSYNFLSKYNFYRSLSFLFLINLVYELYIFHDYSLLFYEGLINTKPLIISANLILWFTFHEKYKRYWKLCGEEAVMDAYYYLLKNKDRLDYEK